MSRLDTRLKAIRGHKRMNDLVLEHDSFSFLCIQGYTLLGLFFSYSYFRIYVLLWEKVTSHHLTFRRF